jgi:pyridoxamine 5'-phosphate oxidase
MSDDEGDGSPKADHRDQAERQEAHDQRDPLIWFQSSFERALRSEAFDASRAALATVSSLGRPSVRFVLVKLVDARGFVFFTNFQSRKARDLEQNPQAALAFHWASLSQQVRIEGVIARISDAESDAYFATRPRASQLGAWASAQSAPIESQAALAAKLVEVTQRFGATERVPRPLHWGGFRLVPSSIEFWRERPGRLHDRLCFTRDGSAWVRSRLQP